MTGDKPRGVRKPSIYLSEQEELFIQHYLTTKKARQSALAAGYSECTSRYAFRWVNDPKKKPRVYEAIRNAMRGELEHIADTIGENKGITDGVLAELSCIAYSDVRKLYDVEGNALPVHRLPWNVAKAIQSYRTRIDENDRSVVAEVKFWPKLGALQTLAQIDGLLEGGLSGNSVQADEDLEKRFNEAKEKAKADETSRLKVVK